ncbi:MAG: toprim domain-containing protein, partial [bacterium]
FEQGTWKEQGKTITTVAFQCPWTDRRWHRLLDIPKGIEGKTRWDKGEGEGYQGQAWTNGEIDPKKELWITEGIFEVLSLQQGADLQAAATFSASHIPSKFYESLDPSQKIIIALNSDRAGQKGTEKNIQTLQELGFKDVVAAQPPYGKDWNDLLVAGAFDEEKREQTIEKALWSGRLLRAESFKEYREIYEENYKGEDGHYHGLLEYRGQTWFCGTKTLKEELELTQTKVCDATVRRAFTQLVEEREYNAEHRYFLRINPVGRTTRIIEASAAELVNGNQARIMLKQRADVLLLDSSTPIINALVTRLEREKSPVVWMVDRLGYDKKSDCWLFGRFLYTSQGNRVEANEFGYFDQQQVRSKT